MTLLAIFMCSGKRWNTGGGRYGWWHFHYFEWRSVWVSDGYSYHQSPSICYLGYACDQWPPSSHKWQGMWMSLLWVYTIGIIATCGPCGGLFVGVTCKMFLHSLFNTCSFHSTIIQYVFQVTIGRQSMDVYCIVFCCLRICINLNEFPVAVQVYIACCCASG